MRRTVDEPLMNFCVQQYFAFHENDWQSMRLPKELLATAAFVLAYSEWYGHKNSLLTVGRTLMPEVEKNLFSFMKKQELSPSRFLPMVSTRIHYEKDHAVSGKSSCSRPG